MKGHTDGLTGLLAGWQSTDGRTHGQRDWDWLTDWFSLVITNTYHCIYLLFKFQTKAPICKQTHIHRRSSPSFAWLPETSVPSSTCGCCSILSSVSARIINRRGLQKRFGGNCEVVHGRHFVCHQRKHFKCAATFFRHNNGVIYSNNNRLISHTHHTRYERNFKEQCAHHDRHPCCQRRSRRYYSRS